MTQTHADIPEKERNEKGITDKLIRISVGIESLYDLKEDLYQAVYNASMVNKEDS